MFNFGFYILFCTKSRLSKYKEYAESAFSVIFNVSANVYHCSVLIFRRIINQEIFQNLKNHGTRLGCMYKTAFLHE